MLVNTHSRAGSPRLRADHVLNLSPVSHTDATVLRTAQAPRILLDAEAAEGIVPLTTDNGGATLIAARGRTLLSVSSGTATEICTLPSNPSCALIAANMMTLMTARGPFRLDRDTQSGAWLPQGLPGDFPAVCLTARAAGVFSAVVRQTTLDKLGAACAAAYTDIAMRASATGLLVQPVLARAVMRDSSGRILHTTPPVAVMLPAGAQLADTWNFTPGTDDKGNEVADAATFSAQAYVLHISAPDGTASRWADTVDTLEIQVSPQFHPLDSAASASVISTRGEGTRRITVVPAGAGRCPAPTRPGAAALLLAGAAARFSTIARTAMVIKNPFATALDRDIPIAAAHSPAREADTLAASLAAPINVPEDTDQTISRPFSARSGTISGNTVAWSGITPLRAEPPSPLVWAATTGNRRFEALTRVRFSTGDCIFARHSGSCNPTAISPLTVYPDADAVELAVNITVDGVPDPVSFTVPLRPDASGLQAVGTAESPLHVPVDAPEADLDVGEAVQTSACNTSLIAIARAADPLSVTATTVTAAPVTCILPARSSGAAWDFGRARFLVFSSAGMEILAVNASRNTAALNNIGAGAIANAHCAADSGDRIYALAGRMLLAVTGSTVRVIDTDVPGDRLAWIAPAREVVVADTDDNVARHYPVDLSGHYETSLVIRGIWLAHAGNAFFTTAAGLLSFGEGTPDPATPVRWRGTLCSATARRTNVRAVRIPLKCSHMRGIVTVSRAWLTGVNPAPAPMARMTIDGAVRAPFLIPVSAHAPVDITVSVEADVSADFSLSLPTIISKP
ncbi:MAG: hypothetical protein Q4F07_05505 [Bacteroidales bacterium]|nr:hypothetical protein [Bacteroidales bacterium]